MNDATQFFDTTAAGGYAIERSLRFNSSDSAYLSRTPASAGNRKTWTWAGWTKIAIISGQRYLFTVNNGGSVDYFHIENADKLVAVFNGSNVVRSAWLFRDPSAWYHIVLSVDTTQVTASDRVKLYVNGTQITNLTTATYPAQNTDTHINSSGEHRLGAYFSNYSDFYLADIHFIDGQALDPTSFGEFDANGIWQPIEYTGTYGTNGFHLPFSDNSTAAALGTDTSGAGNDWTVNNISAPVNSITLRPRSTTTWTATGGMQNHPYFQAPANKTASNFGYISSKNWNTSVSTTGGTMRIDFASPIASAGDVVDVFQYNASYESPTLILDNSSSISPSSTTLASNPAYKYSTFTIPAGRTCSSVFTTTASGSRSNFFGVMVNDISVLTDDPNVGNDSLVDTPTSYGTDTGAGGEVRGNYATLNPLDKRGDQSDSTYSNGNLDLAGGTSFYMPTRGTIAVSSGKWYWEVTRNSGTSANFPRAGFGNSSMPLSSPTGTDANSWVLNMGTSATLGGQTLHSGAFSGTASPFADGDVAMFAYDADTQKVWFGKNGTWLNSGNPAAGTNEAYSGVAGPIFPAFDPYAASITANFGQRPFAYTAPSGFKALVDTNLDAPVVAQPSTVMDVKLYTGNGSTQTISGLGFSPDFAWFKSRSTVENHVLSDTVRGSDRQLFSNLTNAEQTNSTYVTSFTSDGFSLGSNTGTGGNNINNTTYAAWCWDAGSSTVTNTQGSITSSVRANPSAGFSIVTYTGTGSAETMGHGLGVAPGLIIQKRRTGTSQNWYVYHSTFTTSEYLNLNTTGAKASISNLWGTINSSVFGFLTDAQDFVAYCFAPVAGYSSFGSYTGNGSTDGPFVYTGFRPAFIIIKITSTTSHWVMFDSKRSGYNAETNALAPSSSQTENYYVATPSLDLLSNGFKFRTSSGYVNYSGASYIYCAFAESPFQYARAR